MTATHVEFRIFHGPNVYAPFAAVCAEFASPFASLLDAPRLAAALDEALPADIRRSVAVPPQGTSFPACAAALATALQDAAGPCELPCLVQDGAGHGGAERHRILLGYHDVHVAHHALRAALEIAASIFARVYGGPDRRTAIDAAVRRAEALAQLRQPDYIARALMRAARKRGIPVYSVAPGSRTWLYGQGRAGVQFFEAATQDDAYTGARITRDKQLTHQVVARLGLPATTQVGVADEAGAVAAGARLGYPVVVKPADARKGRGVTANIASEEALRAAFRKAAAQATGGVLVERHVAGDDHRIAVIDGRFAWAVRRSPPRVVGDGSRTIEALIAAENARRSEADVAAGFVTRLVIDADMRSELAKEGLTPADRPETGRVVRLRSIANTATGGTIEDCSADVHPDNRAMAETIARVLHMDALGIDFMTTDIARSWRELPCAVLEVNATPGFSSDGRAELILRTKFPGDTDARIPCVVLVGADAAVLDRVAAGLAVFGDYVGVTDATRTRLGAVERGRADADLSARGLSLILDPGCAAVAIGVAEADLVQHGFPLDRCDVVWMVGATPSDDVRALIERVATRTLESPRHQPADADYENVLAALTALRPVRR